MALQFLLRFFVFCVCVCVCVCSLNSVENNMMSGFQAATYRGLCEKEPKPLHNAQHQYASFVTESSPKSGSFSSNETFRWL